MIFSRATAVSGLRPSLTLVPTTPRLQGIPFEVTGREMYGFGNRGLYGYLSADKEGIKKNPYKTLFLSNFTSVRRKFLR